MGVVFMRFIETKMSGALVICRSNLLLNGNLIGDFHRSAGDCSPHWRARKCRREVRLLATLAPYANAGVTILMKYRRIFQNFHRHNRSCAAAAVSGNVYQSLALVYQPLPNPSLRQNQQVCRG